MVLLEDLKQPALGIACRKLREECGVSVGDFSKLVPCSRQSVYNFEDGKTQSLEIFLTYFRVRGWRKKIR